MSPTLRFLHEAPRRALLGLVRGYRLFISPALGASCRFEPSCSAYALGALDAHGAALGSYLTLRRLVRCGPWCEGGHDPVPGAGLRLRPSVSADAVSRPASPSTSSTASPRP